MMDLKLIFVDMELFFTMVCWYLLFEGENNKILFKNIVPENLRKETQELISAILRDEPNERVNIDEIKNHYFYLKGKELSDIGYIKLQRLINRKRHNMNNNIFVNYALESGDVEFINQKIKYYY